MCQAGLGLILKPLKGPNTARLERITVPLRGILSIPIKHHEASKYQPSQGDLARPVGCCGVGLAGEAEEAKIVGIYYLFRLSLLAF